MRKIATVLLLFFTAFLSAQDRPKVGLVLSGGGAKGFAHIGVLQVLDSLGIPVDMVGGTSMGAIVGGFYAIGHSPEDLENLVTTTDWDFVTNPTPQRKYLSFYEKSSHERYILNLNLTKDGLQIPSGLNPGERIINLLSYNTVGYHEDLDFTKDLPIPFVCVATELNTGKEQVINSGILPLAMRSSMSIPSLFNPYNYKGTFLIDGGTVNNFPADHIRDLGADIIIGVDVQTAFSDTLSHPNFISVLEKTSMYVNAMTTVQREALCDLIVHPKMTEYGVTSFDDAAAIIAEGKKAARANMEALLAIREKLHGAQSKTVQPYLPPDRIKIDVIYIKGTRETSKSSILGNLGFEEGDTVSFDQIDEAMLTLHGTNQFNLVNYLAVNENGKTVLKLSVEEKPSPIKTKIGLRYDSDFETSALVNLTARNQLINGSYFSFDFAASRNPRIEVTFLGTYGSLIGFGADYRYWNYKSDLRSDAINAGEYTTADNRFRLYLTKSWRRSIELKLGLAYHELDLNSNVSTIETFFEQYVADYDNLELFFQATFDDRDRSNYASNGVSMLLETVAYKETKTSNSPIGVMIDFDYEHNYSLSDKFTLRTHLYTSLNFYDKELNFPYAVNLGGYGKNYINNNIRFYGSYLSQGMLGYRTISEDNFIFGEFTAVPRIDLQYELFENHFVLLGGNVAYLSNEVEDPFNPASASLLGGFAVEYGINTIVGPISVAVHKSTNHSQWIGYLNIGYWF